MLLLALCAAAGAEELDAATKSKAHFEAGRALYRIGSYSEALREFQAGYELAPRPQFLVNIGQAYRKLGEASRAKESFEKYLAAAPADSLERPQIERLVAELTREIAASSPPRTPAPPPQTAPPAEPAPSGAPAPAMASPQEPAPQPTAAPAVTSSVLTQAPPPARKKSFIARHWWIVPVAAVVAAGLAVGIYYAARPTTVQCGDSNVILCASAH